MNELFIDTSNSGISGDMFLASLLDLIPNQDEVLHELEELKYTLDGVSNLEINLEKMEINGIQLNRLRVVLKEDKTHRTPKTMLIALDQFLDEHPIFKGCKEYAVHVLKLMFQAEAKVHGKKMEDIHLHELSSVDTLIDILGVSICLDILGVFDGNTQIHCSILPLGGGFSNSAHGKLPIPAPATLKILEKSNIMTIGGPIKNELVTPTGAALLVSLSPIYIDFMPEMIIKKVAYSTGQNKFQNFPNILRLFYGESKHVTKSAIIDQLEPFLEEVSVIETNIDDISGEMIGHFINTLNKDKYLDVQVIPGLTKKNRPSNIIQLICHPKDTFDMIYKIIYELGTLGVRYSLTKRFCVDRKFKTLKLELQNKTFPVKFKIAFIKFNQKLKILNVKPEYEDLYKISKETGLTVKEIMTHCQSHIIDLYNASNF